MKFRPLFIILFCLAYATTKAQTVSPDNKAISFVVTDKTSKADIAKADSIFVAHGISLSIKASRRFGSISKVRIALISPEGNVSYVTNSSELLRKGISIIVDRRPGATVAVGIGPNKS